MFLVSYANGSMERVEKPTDLNVLQEIVGGWIECVPITCNNQRFVMIVDEEGKLKGKDVNVYASQFLWPYDLVAGTAIFLRVKGEDFTGLKQKDLVSFALARR